MEIRKKTPANQKTAAKQERRGRPATGRVRPEAFLLRLSAEERATVDAAAAAAELPPTVWARETLLRAARRLSAQ